MTPFDKLPKAEQLHRYRTKLEALKGWPTGEPRDGMTAWLITRIVALENDVIVVPAWALDAITKNCYKTAA